MASPLDTQAVLIRDAIVRISEVAPSSARSMIEQYLRLIAPSLAHGGTTSLPFTVLTKIGNEERYSPREEQPMKYTVLCFHIGSAILAYYQSVRERTVLPILERRTDFLGRVAKLGMERMTVGGSNQTGYYLSEPMLDEYVEKKYNGVPTATPVKAGIVSDGRGGVSSGSPETLHGQPTGGTAD